MTYAKTAKRTKVCFVCPKAYPLFNPAVTSVFGGAEVDLYLLATELAKDDAFDVSCITADYAQPETEQIENVTIIKSLDFKQNQITGAIKIWKAMKKADAQVYMLETLSLGIPLAAIFCRLNNISLVYRTASTRECDGTYLRAHPLIARLIFHFLRKSGNVIVQNDSDRDEFLLSVKVKSKVIANGQRLPKEISMQKNEILWVGRSDPVKRPEIFLELAKRVDAPFTMICQKATGDDNYQALLEDAKNIPNLTFIERVPFGEIDTFFRNAKVLVNTSDSEGFPNTFIQAAKYATAILSLNVDPDNFLQKYNCGVCCQSRKDNMDEQLSEMLDKDRSKEMGLRGREYVKDHHDVDKVMDQYKPIFRELVKSTDLH